MPTFVSVDARGTRSFDHRILRSRAQRMLVVLGVADHELSVLLTDDVRIEALNRKHRRKAKPTDVLAFPMDFAPNGTTPRLLGDIVISLDTAARQARERRRPLIAEVTHLVAHGLLHLLGYDHRTDAEERRMDDEVVRLVHAASQRERARKKPVERAQRSRLTPRAR